MQPIQDTPPRPPSSPAAPPTLRRNNRLAGFLAYVDAGVRPVLAATIERELDTFGSSEGRRAVPGLIPSPIAAPRRVSFIVDARYTAAWLAFISDLSERYQVPFTGAIRPEGVQPDLCNHPYAVPSLVEVSWPVTDAALASQMTTWLAEALRRGEHPRAY